MKSFTSLTVLYDSDCNFCIRCKSWLESQNQRIKLKFVAYKSDEASKIIYALDQFQFDQIVVVTDYGDVFYNEKALLICLYSLTDYYEWAFQFSKPVFYPLIRNFYLMLSSNREWLSRYFGNYSETRKLELLKKYESDEKCRLPARG